MRASATYEAREYKKRESRDSFLGEDVCRCHSGIRRRIRAAPALLLWCLSGCLVGNVAPSPSSSVINDLGPTRMDGTIRSSNGINLHYRAWYNGTLGSSKATVVVIPGIGYHGEPYLGHGGIANMGRR